MGSVVGGLGIPCKDIGNGCQCDQCRCARATHTTVTGALIGYHSIAVDAVHLEKAKTFRSDFYNKRTNGDREEYQVYLCSHPLNGFEFGHIAHVSVQFKSEKTIYSLEVVGSQVNEKEISAIEGSKQKRFGSANLNRNDFTLLRKCYQERYILIGNNCQNFAKDAI